MQMRVGKTDGDIGRTYGCPVCEFALAQPDHSPLHLCWGWNWDGDGSYGKPVWDYIFFCLDNNETPSATAWEAVHRQHQELHLQENSA